MPIYNRTAAVAYALKFALKGNWKYPPLSNDCTSFVSQALLTGGWTMVGGSVFDRADDDVWWWGESLVTKCSYTWGGAHNFSKFIAKSGRGRRIAREELKLGDVVQVVRPDGHVNHTMMVTGLMCTQSGDGAHLSYHTTNTQNKALSAIEQKYAAGNFTFIYWRINDSF